MKRLLALAALLLLTRPSLAADKWLSIRSKNIVLHEYVHFLLRENVGGLPLWITEGLAECYSTFEMGNKANEFSIGRAPEHHLAMLNQTPQFIPLKRLLSIQQNSLEYNEASKQGMFYAESWAFVHYLILGAEGKRRTQFVQLLTALTKGAPFEDSFGEAFQTDYGTLEDEVREYVRKRTNWPTMKVTSRENLQIDVRSMTTTTLSEAESELDRKSTRLNSSHANISYAVFCLKKK